MICNGCKHEKFCDLKGDFGQFEGEVDRLIFSFPPQFIDALDVHVLCKKKRLHYVREK